MDNKPGKKRKLSDLGQALDNASDIDEIRKILRDESFVLDPDDIQGPMRIRKHVLKFDKALNQNQQMRIRFADEPEKFMDSEIKLNDELENLTQELSADSSMYQEFVRLGALDSCLSLLSHENIDIAISTIRLLNAMFDIDSKEEEEHLVLVCDRILKADGFPILVETITRFDETQEDDREAVSLLLATFEAILEIDSSIGETLAQTTNIITVLSDRFASKVSTKDENQLAAADLLAVLLLQGGSRSRQLFAQGPLTKAISILRGFLDCDPSGDSEKGLVENLFSSVTCMLLDPPLRTEFELAGGLQFCLDSIRSKNFLTFHALKVLNLAIQKTAGNCQKFIDLGGLKALFAAFMNTSSKRHRKYKLPVKDEEECLVSIIANLFMQTSDIQYQRLLSKFAEKNCEKIDRLVALRHAFEENEQNSASEQASFALQMADLVLGFVLTAGHREIREHSLKQLQLHSVTVEEVTASLKQLHDEVGDDVDGQMDDDAQMQRNIIIGVISRLQSLVSFEETENR